jgi:hypothetical protein
VNRIYLLGSSLKIALNFIPLGLLSVQLSLVVMISAKETMRPKCPSQLIYGGSINTRHSSASDVMASALGNFTSMIAETFKIWQERQSYLNADPCLKKKYDDLVLSERIAEMEKAAQSRTFSIPHGRNSSIITPRNNMNI